MFCMWKKSNEITEYVFFESSSKKKKKDPDVIDLCGSGRMRNREATKTKKTKNTKYNEDDDDDNVNDDKYRQTTQGRTGDAFELARAIDLSKAQQKEREKAEGE